MKIYITILFGLMTFILSSVPNGYRLVWSDEFDKGYIDKTKWGYEIGGNGWGNNELQYYTSYLENAYVEDNLLHIRAFYNGKNYTSARLLTKGKFDFQYGYVEARIALPRVNGIWPSFWMLGKNFDSIGWPNCGEIDILEALNEENKSNAACYWFNDGLAEYGLSSGYFDVTQFHTYSMYWDRKKIQIFVDNNQIYEIDIKDGTGNTWAFHKRFFFILNVAVGGNRPGWNIDNDKLPAEMLVDYIRVYQQK